jgi:osmotically-inducible protein OsmY
MRSAGTPRFEKTSQGEEPRSVTGLRRGLPVFCLDSRRPVGKVDGWLDSPGRGTDVLVRSGWLNPVVRRVPGFDVDSVFDNRVLLHLDRWQFLAKPRYVPDDELELAVYEALRAVGPIRYHALRRIEVEARHGIVRLSGHVAKDLHRHEALEVVSEVPGVVRVDDQLVSDEQLVTAVALAMRPHPQLQPSRVTVSSNLGTVILEGELDSAEDAELATNVAAAVPGVVSVDSRLRIRGADPAANRAVGWPSGGDGSKIVVLVSGEPAPMRPTGELVIERDALTEVLRKEVVR